MGLALVLLLLYTFLGVAVASDIFMEAIAKITSRTEKVEVKDIKELKGESRMIGVPVWNSRIANVVLLALGSAAPEIFLSCFSILTNIESVPNALGPMVLIGSASFNLLVVTGMSILAATEIKRVLHLNAFIVTAAFATFAFAWLFMVLVVFSPAYVEFWEAAATLALYPLLLFFVWATEKCSPEGAEKELESNRRMICKQSLCDMAEAKGKMYVMDAVTNTSGAPEDVGRVQEYFKVCLGVKDLSNVEIDELLQVLEAENPIERIAYRQNAKSFTKVLVADFIAGEKQEKDASFSAQTIDESVTAKDSESVIPNNTDAEVVESTSVSHHHGEDHEQAELVEKNNCIIEISPEEKDTKVEAHYAALE